MKRIIIFVLLFAALKVAGQTTGYLRFDTVKIMKQGGACELYIINKTKDSLGLLTNVGGGLTQFKKPKVLNDSTIVIGNDTLVLHGASGGGITPSWQQTLNVSNVTSSTLVHDTTLVGNPVEKLWNIYYPLVKTDTVTDPFRQWQSSGSNNGSFNEVMMWGWNLNAGGGPMTLGHGAIGESWESNYQINPLWPFFSDRLFEKHEIYVSPAGLQYRLSSYTINSNTGTIDYYHRLGTFSLRNIDTNTPFYSILGVSNYTSQTFVNSSNQGNFFGINSVFAQDANTASFTVSGSSAGKPNILYNVDGFTYGYLPSTQVSGSGYDGAEIAFNGVTSGVLAKLLSDSARTTLTNFTNVPISFVVNGITPMELRSTRVNISQPTAIGAGITTPIAELDVRSNSQDQTAYVENGKNGGYAAILTATGGAGGNIGLDITAVGTSANKGINFNTSMTASDWNIFSAGSSKAYIAGNVGIGAGNTSPDSTLSVIGSFHTTGGIRMDNLPNAPGAKSVRYDPATGIISYEDTVSGSSSYTFSNGLTESGGAVKLGGTLTGPTHISGGPSGYALQLDSMSSISLFSGLEYVSSGIGSVIQMSDSVMNIGSSSATDFTSMVFSPTRIKFIAADGSGNSGDVWTNSGSGYGHWAAPSSSGITSINSKTGPAITVSGAGGIIVSSLATNTIGIAVDATSDILPRSIDKQYSDANNTGTGETDLYTKSIAAGTLSANGQSLHFEAAGTLNDPSADAALQLYFGGTSFANTSAQALSAAGSWAIKGYIIRTSSSTARAYAVISSDKMPDKSYVFTLNLTGLDFTTSNIFKVTGQASGAGGGSNDITQTSWVITYQP